jgi:SAM-dependent methyltransferase
MRRLRRHSAVADYVTADLGSPEADLQLDITSMAISNDSFDVIICSHVLEHVAADRVAMKELARVLRPGRVAYIQIPYSDLRETDEDPEVIDPKERERRFGQFDHVRLYGRDFESRLCEAGFAVTKVRASSIVSAQQMKRYGLWDDVIWRCERPVNDRILDESNASIK